MYKHISHIIEAKAITKYSSLILLILLILILILFIHSS